jgi:thioredoxin-like negative regulator of GroEL
MSEVAPSEAETGNRAEPAVDAVMDQANKAYDRGDFEQAKALASDVLAKLPGSVRMMRIMVSASCIEGDTTVAQRWFDKLPPADREQMKIRCDRYEVSFREPPGAQE